MADSVRSFSQSYCSICISVQVEFYNGLNNTCDEIKELSKRTFRLINQSCRFIKIDLFVYLWGHYWSWYRQKISPQFATVCATIPCLVKNESKSNWLLLLKKKRRAKPLFSTRYATDELIGREHFKLYNRKTIVRSFISRIFTLLLVLERQAC